MSSAQQQSQKKVKLLQAFRNIESEQLSKLQQKYQFEQDFLEDIRAFAKQKSAIEKEYGQGLQKLASQYLQKRDFVSRKNCKDNTTSPLDVWKKLLDESEKVGKQHLAMSEALQTQVADNIKTLKANKAQTFKKCQELAQKIQEELLESIKDTTKAKKGYMELEKLAQVSREQASEAEDKLKKKNMKFFQSKAVLEKNATKSSNRMDVCERRLTMARNDYILTLAAANAHVNRYYGKELKEILETQDGDLYEKQQDYFITFGQLEVEASSSAKSGFDAVLTQANLINREQCFQSFLFQNKVFTEISQLEFESWGNDKVQELTSDYNTGLALNKEARKLAMRLAKENKNLREKGKQLQGLKLDNGLDEPDGNQETEQNPEVLKEDIRRSETTKLKTEACLDLLRDAGVNVDEWMKSANSLSPAEDSGAGEEDDDFDDEWDLDVFSGDCSSGDEDSVSVSSSSSLPVPCRALYNFEATSADELTITENEELEILERDGEGWCKGRNKMGAVGFFPESYVDVIRSKDSRSPSSSTQGSTQVESQLGVSPSSTASAGSQRTVDKGMCRVRALYDYEGMSDEELSFKEGDIIIVLQKEDDLDDGFWTGEINGKRGVFPALVVEEIEQTDAPDHAAQMADFSPVDKPTNLCPGGLGDYVTLPPEYCKGRTSQEAPTAQQLKATRHAPPPPSSHHADINADNFLAPMDRQRARTENAASLRGRSTLENQPSYSRSLSQGGSATRPLSTYENINQLHGDAAKNPPNYVNYSSIPSSAGASSRKPPDYVNFNNIPSGASGTTSTDKPAGRGRPKAPPKPPPPSARRAYTSKSYV